jgi:outer membrane receptor protein involved in Fe transport
VPSASIGYKLTQTSNFRFGYDMRIYRPGIWYLNPYLDDSNPTNISQGNSFLDSEKSHSFSLNYSNFTPKFNINLSLRYGFTRNSIEQVTKLINDTRLPGLKNPTGKDVLYSTYENIGHREGTSLNAYINWNATKNTRIYANSRLSYTDMDDGGTLRNHGWDFYAYGGAQQTLPKDWRISFNIYATTPRVSLQGRGSSYSSYSVNIQKSWLKKRLNLTLSATNFLKKYMLYDSTMEDSFFHADSWSKSVQQRFTLSISYRIGELKASVKKAERSISNDDVKGGGNSGGSSGSSE